MSANPIASSPEFITWAVLTEGSESRGFDKQTCGHCKSGAPQILRREPPSGGRVVRRGRRPSSRDYDLRDNTAVIRLFQDTRPHIVIHAAGIVGDIGANCERPGEFFYDNLVMGTQVMEQARVFGVQKSMTIGTICAYPNFTAVPFTEHNLWYGHQGYSIDSHRTTASNTILTLPYPEHDLSASRLVRREARSCKATKPLTRLSVIARKLKRCRSACG